ncbi:hypothetical protein [Mycolicibacterium baixiangningiae]|uniref:hypothetical protein n=1 Tax=Mycolicibacterium baixiangningiae TaxID=2761578 RepID=UPI001D025FA4|nr:hypothetical protein [Mycolicibacterium baixiangningiae]
MTESVLTQMKRRRQYADTRCGLLACGRCTDPWTCRCYDSVKVTEQYVDGYRDAAQHLLAQGLAPSPNLAAMRILWRRGGDDQRLAVRLAELWEVAA